MIGYHVRQLSRGLGDLSTIVGTVDYDPSNPGGFVVGEPLNSPANTMAAQRKFELMVEVAKKLPPCSGQDCTKELWRAPSVRNWWMPAGAVRLAWGLWANVLDFQGWKASSGTWQKTYKANDLPVAVNGSLLRALRWVSGQRWKNQIQQWPSWPKDSVKHFIEAHPEFAYEYNGYRSEKYPTADELNNVGGMQRWVDRGGLPLSKRVANAAEPLKTGIVLDSCLAWCRGCVSPSYPDGALTCAQSVQLDPDDRYWSMYIEFGPNAWMYTVYLKREADRTRLGEKIVAPVVWLLENTVGKVAQLVCSTVNKPEAQAGATTAAASYPAAAPAIVAVGATLVATCAPMARPAPTTPVIQTPVEPPVPVTPATPPAPTTTTPPWFGTSTGRLGLIVGGGLLGGVLIFSLARALRR